MKSPTDPTPRWTPLVLAVFVFSVYWATFLGRLRTIDEIAIFAVTESLVKHSSLSANQIAWVYHPGGENLIFPGPSGDLYSHKGVFTSLLAAPLFWLALHSSSVGLVHASLLVNPALSASMAAMTHQLALRLGFSSRAGVATALSLSLGSLVWPYAQTLFTETGVAFLWLSALYLLIPSRNRPRRVLWVSLAGGLVGLSASASIAAAVMGPLMLGYLALHLTRTPRSGGSGEQPGRDLEQKAPAEGRRPVWHCLFAFSAAFFAMLFLVQWLNYLRYGHWLSTGYALQSETLRLEGAGLAFFGLVASPYRGVIWYVPLVLALPPGLWWLSRRRPLEASLCFATLLAWLILFSTWTAWWGGVNWGPRYLVPLMPLLFLGLAPVWEKALSRAAPAGWRLAFFGLAGLSGLVQLVAVFTDYVPYEYQYWLDYGPALTSRASLGSLPILYHPHLSPLWLQTKDFFRGKIDLAWWNSGSSDRLAMGVCLLAVLASGAALVHYSLPAIPNHRLSRAGKGGEVILALAGAALAFGWTLPRAAAARTSVDFRSLIEIIQRHARADDAVLHMLPYDYGDFANIYKLDLPVYGLPGRELELRAGEADLLERITRRHSTLWMLSTGSAVADPENAVDRWLVLNTFKALHRYEGQVRFSVFSVLQSDLPAPRSHGDLLGNAVRLVSSQLPQIEYGPGQIVPLLLTWEAVAPPAQDATVFIHLVDSSGSILAQRDVRPLDGYLPAPMWSAGQQVADRYGLLLPPDAPPGAYSLYAGMYDSITGQRLRVTPSRTDDRILIGSLLIVP